MGEGFCGTRSSQRTRRAGNSGNHREKVLRKSSKRCRTPGSPLLSPPSWCLRGEEPPQVSREQGNLCFDDPNNGSSVVHECPGLPERAMPVGPEARNESLTLTFPLKGWRSWCPIKTSSFQRRDRRSPCYRAGELMGSRITLQRAPGMKGVHIPAGLRAWGLVHKDSRM